MRARDLGCLIMIWAVFSSAFSQTGTIARFPLTRSPIGLSRPAQPSTYFDKAGRRFAILGFESGTFEAWAYPLKLLRNFEFAFFLGTSTEPIRGKDAVRFIHVTPEATTLTYTHQSFTVRATYLTPVDEPGALILLDVDTTEPLTIVCSFLPVMQPMWPAGLGGQYASWDNETRAYLISEPTRKNHGYVGSPAAVGMSYTPAHMLSDSPNQFRIVIAKPDSVRGRYIPIAVAGGKGKREDVRNSYRRLLENAEALYQANIRHYAGLSASTMRIVTPDESLNLAFEWGKVAYDNLLINNPDLGLGLVAGLGPSGTSGRPGFGWFFGGDAFINAFSLNSYGAFQTVRDALAFTQRWQRDDGKMAHELTQAAAYVDWFKDYPYAYIHGDTSPFYIAAMEDYYVMTGDAAFITKSWASIRKAFEWSRSTDRDGDGLMDNKAAGLGASEYGSLTDVQSDIYTSAVWVRALHALPRLAAAAGDESFARSVTPLGKRALQAFRDKFWDNERKQYSYAFDARGNQVAIVSPWSAVGMMWGLGDSARSAWSLEKLNSAELTTDWGMRSISIKTPMFEPLNYNYGAVWPFLTSWVATAQYKHHLALQGYGSLMASVRHTFDNGLGVVTEVFSGYQNVWPQEAVAHQGFCTAGVILPLARGLLGLESDAVEGTMTFAPHFPADWQRVEITGFRFGNREVDLRYTRSADTVRLAATLVRGTAARLRFAPALAIGTTIRSVLVNGNRQAHAEASSAQTVQPVIDFPLATGTTVTIAFDPGVELLPPRVETRTGDTNKGLKIISTSLHNKTLTVCVEGLAGEEYILGVNNPKAIASLSGAFLSTDGLLIRMPSSVRGEFVSHKIVILTQ